MTKQYKAQDYQKSKCSSKLVAQISTKLSNECNSGFVYD